MKRLHCIVTGDVQGVGFRSWTKWQAKKLGLAGWVKNRADKSVELVAEGDETALKELLNRCMKGPDIAWVERVDPTWSDATDEFTGFAVVY